MKTFRSRRSELYAMAASFGPETERLAKHVLELRGFGLCTGSVENKHHYGSGGLQYHTWEVAELCLVNRDALHADVSRRSLFLAALFHDVGKVWDYELHDPHVPGMGNALEVPRWIGTPHKRLIHHISRSALVWSQAIAAEELPAEDWHDQVLHAILSHHGCREFGSPVSPHTKMAWLLHICDLLSARMEDCDRIDRFS